MENKEFRELREISGSIITTPNFPKLPNSPKFLKRLSNYSLLITHY